MSEHMFDDVEAMAQVLLEKVRQSAGELDRALVTRRVKTQEKEDGSSREEVVESQEQIVTGLIDHRALKNLTAALKDIRCLLPGSREAEEMELRLRKLRQELEEKDREPPQVVVRFLGGEEPWRN